MASGWLAGTPKTPSAVPFQTAFSRVVFWAASQMCQGAEEKQYEPVICEQRRALSRVSEPEAPGSRTGNLMTPAVEAVVSLRG